MNHLSDLLICGSLKGINVCDMQTVLGAKNINLLVRRLLIKLIQFEESFDVMKVLKLELPVLQDRVNAGPVNSLVALKLMRSKFLFAK